MYKGKETIVGKAPQDTVKAPRLARQIFVNRNLRMDTIKAIGFDMDYTIARYHKTRIESLAHQLTVKKLIARGYPKAISKIKFDPDFVVRGLTVDKKLGNILKLDRHGHVGSVYHGRKRVPKSNRKQNYRHEKLRFEAPRFALVDTYFELPEICLYADLIDLVESQVDSSIKADPWQLFDDIRECIDEVHRDNSLKTILKDDLKYYIENDEELPRTLHKFRSAGKKLFLLTNSFGQYSEAVMSHLLNDQLAEYPSWRNYFDVIIVGAGKPGFFTENEPITRLDDQLQPTERGVKKFEKGEIYQGGNARDFENLIKCSGEEIPLYWRPYLRGHPSK